MRRNDFLLLLLALILTASRLPAHVQDQADPLPASREVVPMIFPVMGRLTERLIDSFGFPRPGGRTHQGQDLMAKRFTPLVAAFSGTVHFRRTDTPNTHNILTLQGDNGYTALYMHINNDNPDTDDGLGSKDYAFAPYLKPGQWVAAGQFLGWVGDSGNAEETGPHLHFELWRDGQVINAYPSLKQAQQITAARYPLPVPDMKPLAGETRLDGVILLSDLARNVLQVKPVAYLSPSGKQTVITSPTAPAKWVRITAETRLQLRSDPTQAAALQQLQAGDPITVFISVERDPKKSQPILVASRALTAPSSPPSVPIAGRETGGIAPMETQDAPLPNAPAEPPAIIPLLAPPADLAARLLAHINFYRRERGLTTLKLDARLNHAAQSHARYLMDYDRVDHRGQNNSDVASRIKETGYSAVVSGECLASQQNTPEKAVEYWRISPAHRDWIYYPAIQHIGIGYLPQGTRPGTRLRHLWVLVMAVPSDTSALPSEMEKESPPHP